MWDARNCHLILCGDQVHGYMRMHMLKSIFEREACQPNRTHSARYLMCSTGVHTHVCAHVWACTPLTPHPHSAATLQTLSLTRVLPVSRSQPQGGLGSS